MTDEYKELFSRQPGHHKPRILYRATPIEQAKDNTRSAEQQQEAPQLGTSELYSIKLNIYRLRKTATRESQTRSKIRRAQAAPKNRPEEPGRKIREDS